jgi:predicted KAP-like P-loop ATPase
MGKLSVTPVSEWTFEADDNLALRDFATRLFDYLIIDHHFATSSLVVSLDAPFGSGKTTFLSMWKNQLTTQRQQDSSKPLPVLINAWKDDFCGDPLLALLLSLIEAAKSNTAMELPNTLERLTKAISTIAWFSVGLGNSYVNSVTGIDFVAASKLAEEKTVGKVSVEVSDLVKLYEYRQSAVSSLRECLAEAFGGDEVKAIVIVDELDRCRPDYAITFLETIKHIFDLPGVVFVLAIDRDQIACCKRPAKAF